MISDVQLLRTNEMISHRETQINAKINSFYSSEMSTEELKKLRNLSERMKAIIERALQIAPKSRLDFHKETLKQLTQKITNPAESHECLLTELENVVQGREQLIKDFFPPAPPAPSTPLIAPPPQPPVEKGICCHLY